MSDFYDRWNKDPAKGKAEALRQAQLAFVHGAAATAGANTGRGFESVDQAPGIFQPGICPSVLLGALCSHRQLPVVRLVCEETYDDLTAPLRSDRRLVACICSLHPPAFGQEEIPPPQGKGHVVVFVSGIDGPKHNKALSEAIAALGYDVYVCDGREIAKMPGANLRAAIQAAQNSPHALPGKVALVGVSLGGGFALALGSEWPDLVAADIVWYPAPALLQGLPVSPGASPSRC